jgi:hypothetical protein
MYYVTADGPKFPLLTSNTTLLRVKLRVHECALVRVAIYYGSAI